MTSGLVNNIHELVVNGSELLSGLVLVNEPPVKTLLSNQSCGDIEIPNYMINDGVDSDLVVFITARYFFLIYYYFYYYFYYFLSSLIFKTCHEWKCFGLCLCLSNRFKHK